MPFTPINVVAGSTAANATWGNNVQVQYTEATNSFGQDEYTPFVLSGLVASKDATTASKLNITSGVAYPLQGDNTTRRRAVSSASQTTSAVSSTYYLYVQPDGTLYWATTNTPAANSLAIAQVTTDSSGNIATVTDKRTLNTTLLSGMAGALTTPPGGIVWAKSGIGGAFPTVLAINPAGGTVNTNHAILYSGGDGRLLVQNVTAGKTAIQVESASGMVGINQGFSLIGGQTTAGSFGAPVIVAQAIQQHVTNTNAASFTLAVPASGLYRISAAFRTNIASANVSLRMQWTDETPTVRTAYFTISGATSGVANALALGTASAYAGLPMVVYAAAGYNMTVYYTNSTATPDDYVNAFFERLS